MRSPVERLKDILEAIEAIEQYSGILQEHFEQNPLIQVWFVHHLRIIGEAARALPSETRELAPEIPWTKVIGMRNILVHGYFEVDTEVVWATVQSDLIPLKNSVLRLLAELDQPPDLW